MANLEAFVGIELLRRTSGGLVLTDTGNFVASAVALALEKIDLCVRSVIIDQSVIRLQVAPTFAIRWLLPRLTEFARASPEIDVRTTITINPQDFDARNFDAGVIDGDGRWPDLSSTCLSRECLVPVCSPRLQEGSHPIRSIADLRQHTLLHNTTDRRDWPLWLAAIKAEGDFADAAYSGLAFETVDLAVRAAECGYGVAIADLSLITDELAAGRLVIPINRPVYSGGGLHFVCARDAVKRRSIQTFLSWIEPISPATTSPESAFLQACGTGAQRAP